MLPVYLNEAALEQSIQDNALNNLIENAKKAEQEYNVYSKCGKKGTEYNAIKSKPKAFNFSLLKDVLSDDDFVSSEYYANFDDLIMNDTRIDSDSDLDSVGTGNFVPLPMLKKFNKKKLKINNNIIASNNYIINNNNINKKNNVNIMKNQIKLTQNNINLMQQNYFMQQQMALLNNFNYNRNNNIINNNNNSHNNNYIINTTQMHNTHRHQNNKNNININNNHNNMHLNKKNNHKKHNKLTNNINNNNSNNNKYNKNNNNSGGNSRSKGKKSKKTDNKHKQPKKQKKSRKLLEKQKKPLDAQFITDVTIKDRRSVYTLDTVLEKKWKLKNVGTDSWVKGSIDLKFIKGDKNFCLSDTYELPVNECKPGEEIIITALVKTPKNIDKIQARLVAYFRLHNTKLDKLFGPRVWVDVYCGKSP